MPINIAASQKLARPAEAFERGRALQMAQRQAEQDFELAEQQKKINQIQIDQAQQPAQVDPDTLKKVHEVMQNRSRQRVRAYEALRDKHGEEEAESFAQQSTEQDFEWLKSNYPQVAPMVGQPQWDYTTEKAFVEPEGEEKPRYDEFDVIGADGKRQSVEGRVTLRGAEVLTPEGKFVPVAEAYPDAERIEPAVSRGVQSSEPGAFDELPASEATDLRNQEVATRNVVGTAGDIVSLLNESPDINTFTASAGRVINNLQQEGKAVASALNKDFDPGVLDPSTYAETFDEMGIQNAQMKSMFTSLAFQAAAASGQEGRSISDADIRRFLQQSGASESDPRAVARVVSDLVDRSKRAFRNSYEVRTKQKYEGDLGELPAFEGNDSGLDPEVEELLKKYE